MQFKIRFPSGYVVNDIQNYNIDVNVFFSSGEVFFGTLFTLPNIKDLLANGKESYFWSTDMLIVKDLSKTTIRDAISQTIVDEYFESIFCKIGIIGGKNFDKYYSYEDVDDMAGLYIERKEKE
jgi:hypothetical protein